MEYGLVLWWLVIYLVFMAVGMPLATVLFPRLADRGAGVALPTALAVLWVVAYLVGHVSLTAGLIVGLVALLAVAVAIVYRGVEFDRRRYGEAAAVFTVAFLFMIAIRAVDAGVHPLMGEKFLDFGLLQSLLRADALPPEDMWFAGRPVKYYYGGHLVAALLTKITGTEARFAYNLALAGFYGMLVTAAYGLAGSIAASRDLSRVRAGAFGAFFAGFASNVSTPVRFALWVVPDGFASFLAGLFDFELGGVAADGAAGFHYWSASRVIEGTINEFPLFGWLNGDLHAHMMGAPFVLLAASLLFSYYRTPESARTRRRLLVLGTLPPLAGLLAVVNTWSFPTVGGLTFLTLALSPADPVSLLPSRVTDHVPSREDWHRELSRHGVALAGAIAVVTIGALWSLPFWLGTAAGGERSIAFFPEKSSLGGIVFAHGAFALLFAVHLVRHAAPEIESDAMGELLLMLALGIGIAWVGASSAALAIFGPMVVLSWVLMRSQAEVVHRAVSRAADTAKGAVTDGGAPTVESADGADAGTDTHLRDVVGFETLLVVAGAGIVVLVEFVYVQEQAGPERMNTVFKTYADVWVLWAVAAGAVLAHLLENHSPTLALSGDRWASAVRAFAVVLVVGLSVYGAFAVSNHMTGDSPINRYDHPDDPTLNGLVFVNESHAEEYSAVRWFEAREGQPNIASAPGRDMYQWTTPISSLTGVPTVAGWAHEVGYRGGESYRTRVDHVNSIYTGSPEQRAYYLDVYEVEYVYVGSNEREAYSQQDLAGFESISGVTVEKQWGDVVVYRVDQEQLQYPSG
jgi:YYY domain-containing protein